MGCGCFGCSTVFVLTGGLILAVLVATVLLPSWRVNHRYVPGTCQVVDKKLGSHLFDTGSPEKKTKESYRPEIKVRNEVGGRAFETWAYDATGICSDDRAAQQAIVDSFRLGSTYRFWYDPDRPEKAVLVRGSALGWYVFLIVPVGLLALGCAGILVAWKTVSAKPILDVAPAGRPAAEPARVGFLQGLSARADGRDATFDPARFGDPVAMKTDWTPIGSGTGNFHASKLIEAEPDRLEFRATAAAWLFALCFLAAGAVGIVAIVANLPRSRISLNSLVGLPITLGIAAVGGYLLYFFTTPIVFDRRRGFFWKGRKPPDEAYSESRGGDSVRLGEIHAVQVLRRIQSGGRDWYTAYDLNLVLNNGERIRCAGYFDQRKARGDATAVAEFLRKPVWDAS
jgi:hypothetical protein